MKTFWLLPNALCQEVSPDSWATPMLKTIVDRLTGIVAENEKSCRAFLKAAGTSRALQTYPILLLNEHSEPQDLKELVNTVTKDGEWGLVSDQGLACLADPGENLTQALMQRGYRIRTLGAGSSVVHALLVSGFPAERFSFLGYLPKDEAPLVLALKKIEKDCVNEMTQIAIERPYENARLIKIACASLSDEMRMAIVVDIGSDKEEVVSLPIHEWKRGGEFARFNKRPAVFLFGK